MPVNVVEEVMEYIKNKSYINGLEDLNDIIIYRLRTINAKELSNIPDVVEGLENLIIEEANKTNDIIELVNNVKSKRYTQSRIQRILINVMLGITKKDIELSKKVKPYIRVLGVTEKAKELLSEMDGNVITSVKKYEDEKINTKAQFMLEIDKKASNIYSIISKEKSNKDYTEKLIIQ
jgi:predicted nucleotidyltransferase